MQRLDRPITEFSFRHLGYVQTSLYRIEKGLVLVFRRPASPNLWRKTTVELEADGNWAQKRGLYFRLRCAPIPYIKADTEKLLRTIGEGETAKFKWCRFADLYGEIVLNDGEGSKLILPRQTFENIFSAVQTFRNAHTLTPDQKGQVQ